MATTGPLFTVGPPPHWRSRSSVAQMNFAYILALCPAAVIGCVAYGFGPSAIQHIGAETGIINEILRVLVREFGVPAGVLNLAGAFGVLFLGAGTGLVAEYAIQVAFRQPYYATNGHGALMGLLIAMLMPPTAPFWVLMIGVVMAILVGKQIYGGIGAYPFHPAMVGWLVLLLSWPHHIYPVGMQSIASMHWVAIYLTAIGGIGLIALGHVRWQIPLGVIVGVVAGTVLFHAVSPEKLTEANPLTQLISGHVMLAAFFIATDSTSSPSNRISMLIFGLGVGILIMLVRTYGVWPDAVPFAVILMNILSPLLDKLRSKPVQVVIQNG